MDDGGSPWREEVVHHQLFLVAVDAQVVLALLLLEDDVDVAGDQLGDLMRREKRWFNPDDS